MQDRTINNALLALRKQTIREGGEGLAQVEALLQIRGVALPRVMRAKCCDAARRGQMRLLVLAAFRDGPKTLREVSACVAARRPEISPQAAYVRTGQCLARLKSEDAVRREGRVWLIIAG